MTVLCVHRTQPNWAATPDRPRFELVHDGVTYWVETDGPEPSKADLLTVIAPPPPVQTVVDGLTFLGRLSDAEYQAIVAGARSNVQIARWIEMLRLRGEIDVSGKNAQIAKAGLVAAGLLTAARADMIFAAE